MKKNTKVRTKKENVVLEKIPPEVCSLIESYQEIQKLAQKHGIFIEDRELLICPKCGLREDIAIDGTLFTYRQDDVELKDTGLRFIELDYDKKLFQCLICNTEVKASEPKEGEE